MLENLESIKRHNLVAGRKILKKDMIWSRKESFIERHDLIAGRKIFIERHDLEQEEKV